MTAVEPEDAWSLRACPSCGAVVTQPPQRISHGCSYCGSALVEVERGSLVVDRVAPFRISAAAAEERLRQHLAARWWAPERLRRGAREGRLDARLVEGVLVPFYAYDATCRSRYETRVGLYWYETKSVRGEPAGRGGDAKPPIEWLSRDRARRSAEREGDAKPPIEWLSSRGSSRRSAERARKVERHTEWLPLRGTAVQQLRDHLVSASVGLSAEEVAALAPFDLGRTRPFDARLLAGWSAELPSRSRAETEREAAEQIRAGEIRRIGREHLPGDTHRDTRVSCQVELGEAELVLLPVWVAALRYGGHVHRLVVNGQTGRCHGRAPVSRVKVTIAVALVVLAAALVAWRWSS